MTTSTRGKSRKNNVYKFLEFVVATFPSNPSSPTRVLDVAGGKGDLSWLLQHINPAPSFVSCVCDPHNTNHSHITKSVAYLMSHPEDALERSLPGDGYQPLAVILPFLAPPPYNAPRHLRMHFTDEVVDAVRNDNFIAFKQFFLHEMSRPLPEANDIKGEFVMNPNIITGEIGRGAKVGRLGEGRQERSDSKIIISPS